jgi:hypothetical protein
MDADDVFLYIVAGAAEAARKDFRSASPLLQQALNKLTALQLANKRQPQSTLEEVLNDFERPIIEWWPGKLPGVVHEGEVSPSWTILYQRMPDETWVEEFLERRGAYRRLGKSLQEFQADIDQSAILTVQDICRNDPQIGAEVYRTVRRFLIKHPVTTAFDLHLELGNLPLIPMKIIHSFYESPERFERYSRHEERYWECPYCHGILNWIENGKFPRCARHSVCGKLYPDYQGRKPVEEKPGLLRLKWGVHRRVCVPGIPELELYDELEELRKRYPALLTIELWPGVDAYDIQLQFAGRQKTVWAVDMKDYADPVDLYHKIHEADYPCSGRLRWDQAFYVIPQYRISWNPHYITQFKRAAPLGQRYLPLGIEIVSRDQFLRRVRRKLSELEQNLQIV